MAGVVGGFADGATTSDWPAGASDDTQTNWSGYRGGSGHNAVAHIEPPGRPRRVRWQLGGDAEPVHYSTVVGRTAYLNAGTRLLAVDVDDGELIWAHDTGEQPRCPVVDSETVYVGTAGGTIVAVDRRTGEKQWQRITGASLGPATALGDRIYFGGFGERARVFSIVKSTGNAAWSASFDVNYPEPSRPKVAVGNGSVYFVSDDEIRRIDATSGEVVWTDASGRFGPVFQDGTVYTSFETECRDAETGTVRWSNLSGGSKLPVVHEGRVLAIDNELIRSFDQKTGEEQWQFSVNGDEVSSGSIAAGSESTLYVSAGGRLLAVNVADGLGTWEFPFTQDDPDNEYAGGLIPLSDGYLVNFNNTFYMLETESPTQPPETTPTATPSSPSPESTRPRETEPTQSTINGETTSTTGKTATGDTPTGSSPDLLEFVSKLIDEFLSLGIVKQVLTTVSAIVTIVWAAVALLRGGEEDTSGAD